MLIRPSKFRQVSRCSTGPGLELSAIHTFLLVLRTAVTQCSYRSKHRMTGVPTLSVLLSVSRVSSGVL